MNKLDIIGAFSMIFLAISVHYANAEIVINEFDPNMKTICQQYPSATETSFAFRASFDVVDCLPLIKTIVPDEPMNVQFDQVSNNGGFIIFITLLSELP